jgi:hypothetical protein
VPPSDLVVNVDSNYGANRWIRLTINVRSLCRALHPVMLVADGLPVLPIMRISNARTTLCMGSSFQVVLQSITH